MALPLAGHAEVSAAGDRHVQATPADVEFRVGVLHEDDAVRVRPIGEVDLATIGRLRERTAEAVAAGPNRLILDLRGTTFLDSTGLHLAMDLERWATRNGIEFLIIAGPRIVQRAFRAAGLSGRLPVVDGTRHPIAAGAGSRPRASSGAVVVDHRRKRGGRR
jgi:anti-anti-sigma factor